LFAVWDALRLGDRVVLVLHDWGSALGFDWANQHRDRVQGIAHMEALAMPMRWSDISDSVRAVFQALCSPQGEQMVLERNMFVESVLRRSVRRQLTDEEMDCYRAPFRNPGEDRRPMLAWPRSIPIVGKPSDVVAMVDDYGRWLSESQVPKLFINGEPGGIATGRVRDFIRTWPNQTEITVRGVHFLQEGSPNEIGAAIADFVRRLRANTTVSGDRKGLFNGAR
jgi:haloalkane dehalogenase